MDAAQHARGLLKLRVRRRRRAWPDVRLLLRGERGFCRWRRRRWGDRHGVGSLRGRARNSRLQDLAAPRMHEAAARGQATGQPQRLFGTFADAAVSWHRPRRLLVKAAHNAGGDNPRLGVSNRPGAPQGLYDTVCWARGERQNRIQEQALMRFADRSRCHTYLANPFRLLLSVAADVLGEAVRRLGLVGTAWARAPVRTIRRRRFKVAGLVRLSVRRVEVRRASGLPLPELCGAVWRRLRGPAAAAGVAGSGGA
jgi:hypothetical protein